MTSTIACGRCNAEWTGLSACHCTAAGSHITFSSLSAFDQHRVAGQCHDPADRGLVPVTRSHWAGWACPGDDSRWDSG
jgi:hypothetical protein